MKKLPSLQLLVGLLISNAALATSVIEMDISTLTKSSARVVTATVVEQEARFDPTGKIINTYSVIEVDEVLRGKQGAKRRLTIEQIGGTVGDITQTAHGVTLLRKQSRFLLFLQAAEINQERGSVHKITGLAQGVFRIRRNPNGELVAAPPQIGATHRFRRDVSGKLTRQTVSTRATPLNELRATILAVPEP